MSDILDTFGIAAQQIVDKERDGTAWTVFEDYKRVQRDGAWWIEARGKGKSYRPLIDRPYMFYDLATVGRRFEGPDDTDGARREALAWALKYGVLGLSAAPEPERTPGGGLRLYASGDPGDVLLGFGQGDYYRDSITAFVREAWMAGVALTFYEAAMEGDVERVYRLDSKLAYTFYGEKYGDLGGTAFDPEGLMPDNANPKGEARVWGTNAAATITQGRLSAWCAPTFFYRNRRLERGWGFENLAGAAWLQMYWKLTADDEDSLCANPACRYGRPVLQPNTRGRRKKYCSPECKKGHHYKTVTLPRRRASK
jgi:hypothetical protein